MNNAKDMTGKSYEIITQAIFQLIMDQDEVLNVHVNRNIVLQGKTITHQIDVHWTFELAGVRYDTIVQVKDWNSAVDQGRLLQFKGVLDDLPGRPRGIFVTATGYQRGAKQYAKAHDIILYELREVPPSSVSMTTLGWATCEVKPVRLRVSSKNEEPASKLILGFTWTVFEPHFSDLTFHADRLWWEQDPLRPDADLSAIKIQSMPFGEVILYDESYSATSNLALVLQEVRSVRRVELEGMSAAEVDKKPAIHVFERPTFLGPITTGLVSYLKVNSVSMNIEVQRTNLPIRMDSGFLSGFAQFVLHEMSSGKDTLAFLPKV